MVGAYGAIRFILYQHKALSLIVVPVIRLLRLLRCIFIILLPSSEALGLGMMHEVVGFQGCPEHEDAHMQGLSNCSGQVYCDFYLLTI